MRDFRHADLLLFLEIKKETSSPHELEAAKARGVRFGRPEKEVPDDFMLLVKAWEQKQLPLPDLLRRCDMSEATFYRRLREMRIRN